jgi:predicted regulator of Ras-like GTPase activity (Roadblock/LC7/MglB family)
MEWFVQLSENPHIEALLVMTNQGQVLHSTYPQQTHHKYTASMLQSAEALAQALAQELGCGAAQLLQFSTKNHHIILLPMFESSYYLVVLVQRTAPMLLVMALLEQAVQQVMIEDLLELSENNTPEEAAEAASEEKPSENLPELNASELIEAVEEWLRDRSRGDDLAT